MTIKELYCNL